MTWLLLTNGDKEKVLVNVTLVRFMVNLSSDEGEMPMTRLYFGENPENYECIDVKEGLTLLSGVLGAMKP